MIGDIFATIRLLSTSHKIVLASGSPRRRELLAGLCGCSVTDPSFLVVPSTFAEDLLVSDFPSPIEYVRETALLKCKEVYQRLGASHGGRDQLRPLVISADTIVVVDGDVLNKPLDDEEARDMLRRLSGRTHVVHTAVIVMADGRSWFSVASTNVTFAPLSDAAISAYVATGEPRDKAGAYGIQGLGGCFVERIEGEYGTVVGLPIHTFCALIQDVSMALSQST